MYLFGLLTIWLAPEMTANTLVAWIALSVYLFVGAYFEEKKLTRVFGSMYSEYRSRTPMIIPLKKRAARRTWYGKA
jgi:protein-S-isoprenylcysteine O-methyltransferase Ste14